MSYDITKNVEKISVRNYFQHSGFLKQIVCDLQ